MWSNFYFKKINQAAVLEMDYRKAGEEVRTQEVAAISRQDRTVAWIRVGAIEVGRSGQIFNAVGR